VRSAFSYGIRLISLLCHAISLMPVIVATTLRIDYYRPGEVIMMLHIDPPSEPPCSPPVVSLSIVMTLDAESEQTTDKDNNDLARPTC
jgi:hypothetical protein